MLSLLFINHLTSTGGIPFTRKYKEMMITLNSKNTSEELIILNVHLNVSLCLRLQRKKGGYISNTKKWRYCPFGCYTGASMLVQVAWNE